MKNTVTFYSTSPGAFQQRCMYVWHRKFNAPAQEGILKERNASIVTYITRHDMPYGTEAKVVEQTVMKVVLNMSNDSGADLMLLAILVREMKPDGFEVSLNDDTYKDEEAVLVMWWHTRRLPIATATVDPDEHVRCIKVYEDDPLAMAKLRNEFGSEAIYLYGNGPWLATAAPLTQEHAGLLLEMK